MKYLNNNVKRKIVIDFCKEQKRFKYSKKFITKVIDCYSFGEKSIHDFNEFEIDALRKLVNQLAEGSPNVIINLINNTISATYSAEEIVKMLDDGKVEQLYIEAQKQIRYVELADEWLDEQFEDDRYKYLWAELCHLDMMVDYNNNCVFNKPKTHMFKK